MIWQVLKTSLAAGAFFGIAGMASADSIDPTEFMAKLRLGESVTIKKTVVVNAGDPTTALIDVHFLMDTSGSMGGVINAAKAAAVDIFAGIDAFGDEVAGGVGVFSEGTFLAGDGSGLVPPALVINSNLTTNSATTIAAINGITLGVPDFGGDFPESGWDAIAKSAANLEWRAGSNRFMFLFTDASAKGDLAAAQDALAFYDIDLYTLAYGDLDEIEASYGAILGGTVLSGSTDPDELVASIVAGISSGFATYEDVTVSDLGFGLPFVGVSTVCTMADTGVCVDGTATGSYDRSVDRTFMFDVTFTGLALTGPDGVKFDTRALVDGGTVARERDHIIVAPIPLPAALPLLLSAVGVLGFAARRRKAA